MRATRLNAKRAEAHEERQQPLLYRRDAGGAEARDGQVVAVPQKRKNLGMAPHLPKARLCASASLRQSSSLWESAFTMRRSANVLPVGKDTVRSDHTPCPRRPRPARRRPPPRRGARMTAPAIAIAARRSHWRRGSDWTKSSGPHRAEWHARRCRAGQMRRARRAAVCPP
jgi:hypothetical protein